MLLVAGGYSGVARGDLVAFKVPLFVSSDQGDRVSVKELKRGGGGGQPDEDSNKSNVFHQDAFCAEALDESMCLKNPECSWCEGRCREYQPTNPVTSGFMLDAPIIKYN